MDFCQHFLMMEKSYEAELESCFINSVIQCIKSIGKSKVGECPPYWGCRRSPHSTMLTLIALCWVKSVGKGSFEAATSPQSP